MGFKKAGLFILFCIIIKMIFGLGSSNYPDESNIVIVDNSTTTQVSGIVLSVSIQNTSPFTAFQIDLILPDSVDYIDDSAELTDRAQDHIVNVSNVNGHLRIIAYSLSSSVFSGNEGSVLTLQLEHHLNPGTYPVTVAEAIIAGQNSENIITGIINGEITISPSLNTDEQNDIQSVYKVSAYPNPFNESINFKYEIKQVSDVHLKIFNIKGHCLFEQRNSNLDQGVHSLSWKANEQSLPSGIYFYQIETNHFRKTGKIMIIK